jgi:hypothetical protein
VRRTPYPKLARKARRRATGFAWAPVIAIVGVGVVAAGSVLLRFWTGHCNGLNLIKLECDLLGLGLVVAIDVSLFALLVLGWWLVTGLDGLKRIFEVSWPGLDGGDVDTVGPVDSVVRAAAWIVVILASLLVVTLATVAASNGEWFHNTQADLQRLQGPKVAAPQAVPAPPDRAVRDGQAQTAIIRGPEAHP